MKMKTTLAVLLILELYGLSSGLIKQHYFVNEEKDWGSARQHCRDFFHDLSTYTNEREKQQFLEDAVGQTSNAWVGLHKESGVWKWIRNENPTVIFWDSFNLFVSNENCAFIHNSSKKLHGEKCDVKLKFFCMKTFVLVQQVESWEGALEYCRKYYNDLASLSSMNRMNSASEEIALAKTGYVWTGLRFLAGEWRWVDGDDLDFTFWPRTGLPQCPARNLRCGALDKQTRVWTHRDCEEKLNFLCQ